MVEFFNPCTNENISYHIDKRMILFLDKNVKPNLSKKDKDFVLIVDGYEGVGKSTFAQQIGKYVDPTLDLKNICLTATDFKLSIETAKKNQCVIYDEAITGLGSSDSITKIGKLLKSMMMQMRQKNLFVIICLPTIFELNKYAVLSRARGYFHIYENKGRRGYWVGYNKKDTRLTYLKGKKTYSYTIRSFFTGRFYGKYVVDEEEYRKKKKQALFEDDIIEEDKQAQRNQLIFMLYDKYKISIPKLTKAFVEYGIPLKQSAIHYVLQRNKEYKGKTSKLQFQ